MTLTQKEQCLKIMAEKVGEELGCSLVDALIKMREQSLKSGNLELQEDLKNYAVKLILGK